MRHQSGGFCINQTNRKRHGVRNQLHAKIIFNTSVKHLNLNSLQMHSTKHRGAQVWLVAEQTQLWFMIQSRLSPPALSRLQAAHRCACGSASHRVIMADIYIIVWEWSIVGLRLPLVSTGCLCFSDHTSLFTCSLKMANEKEQRQKKQQQQSVQ